MSFPALAPRSRLARRHPLTDAGLVAASLLLPLLSSPAAAGDEPIPCASADYYAWCRIFSAGAIACLPRDDSISPCDIDHLYVSGFVGVLIALAVMLVARRLLPRPLLLAPVAGVLALVLGSAMAFHTDLIGSCGVGPTDETVRLAAWWRGEDPALAEYCRPARPYTPLLELRTP